MLSKAKRRANQIWRKFRGLPLLWQMLLVVPLICGAIPYLLIGNMGLALMGTAIPIYTFLVGWIGGALALIWGKARIKKISERGLVTPVVTSND
jgi:hypothetical protein